jgi:hypothetical protein
VYAEFMNEAVIDKFVHQTTKRRLKRAIDDAYWMGAALGMMAGACLGVMVGLSW